DEEKAQSCRADRRLEKPFDADHLRSIVTDLISKAKENPVSKFLSFPEMPEFEEHQEAEAEEPASTFQAHGLAQDEEYLDITEVEDEAHALEMCDEEFSAVYLTSPHMEEEQDEGCWCHHCLPKFKIQVPDESDASPDFASKFVIPQEDELA